MKVKANELKPGDRLTNGVKPWFYEVLGCQQGTLDGETVTIARVRWYDGGIENRVLPNDVDLVIDRPEPDEELGDDPIAHAIFGVLVGGSCNSPEAIANQACREVRALEARRILSTVEAFRQAT